MESVEINWYCNDGCKYEDSAGFCIIPNKFSKPEDANCLFGIGMRKDNPKHLVPDKFFRKRLEEKYKFK